MITLLQTHYRHMGQLVKSECYYCIRIGQCDGWPTDAIAEWGQPFKRNDHRNDGLMQSMPFDWVSLRFAALGELRNLPLVDGLVNLSRNARCEVLHVR
jgi:hypothetical protein